MIKALQKSTIRPNQRFQVGIFRSLYGMLINLINQRDMIYQLFRKEFFATYKKSFLIFEQTVMHLTFKLPKSIKELMEWSYKLNNCMISYSDKVIKNKTYIYGVFESNELKYAIETNGREILQASGIYNSEICQHDMNIIKQWFNKFKNFGQYTSIMGDIIINQKQT